MSKFVVLNGNVVGEVIQEYVEVDGVQIHISERYAEEFIASLLEIEDSVEVEAGWHYNDGTFAPPPPVVVTLGEVLAQKANLLAAAALRIAPLQDAVDIGEATPEEEALLLQWKAYRVQLNRIHLQAGYHENVVWPTQPVDPAWEQLQAEKNAAAALA